MLTCADEQDLIEDIKDGIGIALDMQGASARSIDSIKLNKLVYIAVNQLNIPLTFGWYKYGPAPIDLQYSQTAVTAKSKAECDAAYDSRLPNTDYYSPVEYAYFFNNELDEFADILRASTKDYLVSFYEREAPEIYRNLYVKNAQLQQVLDEIKTDAVWHEESERYYREISRRIGELTRTLMDIEPLREVQTSFRQYVRFLKKLLANASTHDSLTATQQRFVKRIVDYYYGGTWKYVALKISENTVHLSPGENERKLLTSIENDQQEIRANYEDDLNGFAKRAVALDILEEESANSLLTGSEADSEESRSVDRSDRVHAELWTHAIAEVLSNEYTK
jgi:hypothetical protein